MLCHLLWWMLFGFNSKLYLILSVKVLRVFCSNGNSINFISMSFHLPQSNIILSVSPSSPIQIEFMFNCRCFFPLSRGMMISIKFKLNQFRSLQNMISSFISESWERQQQRWRSACIKFILFLFNLLRQVFFPLLACFPNYNLSINIYFFHFPLSPLLDLPLSFAITSISPKRNRARVNYLRQINFPLPKHQFIHIYCLSSIVVIAMY